MRLQSNISPRYSILILLISFISTVMATNSSAQLSSEATNMGSVINSAARDAEPTFTADGNTMYFNCYGRQGRADGDICISTLVNGQWAEPKVVDAVSTEYGEVEPLLSPDGNQLFIQSNRPGGHGRGDIWVSDLIDGEWSEPKNLDAPINSPYHDHCIYFAGENWEFAYWTSTRPGGFGGNDIWMSEKVDGKWTEATNLGPNVNTAGVEHHSLPSEDGRSLYVTAVRDEGFGGQDIYVTTRDDNGDWGTLTNLGANVNTEENDRCPAFSPDHSLFYFDSTRAGGFGGLDIWYIPYALVENIR